MAKRMPTSLFVKELAAALNRGDGYIMKDGDTVVFVEVKTRLTGEAGWGLSAVNTAKQRRISRAATVWMMQNHCMNALIRFDLVEVHGSEILHIPNAFQPYGSFQH